MENNRVSMPNPEQFRDRKREILSTNFRIWIASYSKGDFETARQNASDLYEIAKKWRINPETLAAVLITKSWSEYYVDKNGKARTNASYLSAREGLTKLQNSKKTPIAYAIRSSLFEVAGLCQAYLVDEKDAKAEPLFRHSIEEAKKSGFKSVIGEAKNGLALWLVSPKQKCFKEAISLFKEVAKIQKEENNKRGEGHAHNNLVVCYNETGQFAKAVEEADKALELYADPNLNHSFSARFRKSLALRKLGKERKDKAYFDQALAIYEEHKKLREQNVKLSSQEIEGFIRNEDANILNTQEEMRELGFV